jgi:hypothetical protein
MPPKKKSNLEEAELNTWNVNARVDVSRVDIAGVVVRSSEYGKMNQEAQGVSLALRTGSLGVLRGDRTCGSASRVWRAVFKPETYSVHWSSTRYCRFEWVS